MSDWIRVEDGLPATAKDVLVSTHNGNVITGGCYVGGEWFDRNGDRWRGRYCVPITHWMPLPEPPQVLCDTLDSL